MNNNSKPYKPTINYYVGNPDEDGNSVANNYELMKESGLLDESEQEGITINPVHDFEQLKKVRHQEYEKELHRLQAQRTYNGLKTTDTDILYFRRNWLQDELTRNVEGWISRNQNSRRRRPSELVELEKYRDLVLMQIQQLTDVKSESIEHAVQKSKEEAVPQYTSFTDLFIDQSQENIDYCIQALRDSNYKTDKPVLGEGLNWIGGPKNRGLIVAWIERMENMKPPKIHRLNNRKYLVQLLNAYFSNLNLGASARNFDESVNSEMKNRLIVLLPK